MRPVEILQVLGCLPWFAGMMLLAVRRRTIRTLERAQAVDEDAAIALGRSLPWHRFVRRRMEGDGVLRQTADGRYWLDRVRAEEQARRRRRRGLTIAACVVALGGALFALVQWAR